MATKAELEAELLDLRRKLAERSSQQEEAREDEDVEALPDKDKAETPSNQMDWDKEVSEIMAELHDLPHKQQLLIALGAFAIGFLAGRAR
ncbi:MULTISPECIES: hypothetical protein [Halocynthiibacter]|uniref:Uncharacterized protein n=1 Tax=Halocynthiibacter halioticoli TaxID=2986804 RepID=A0AAE3LSL2_9RHOB|nr:MULTISPECIES: hypothetical protein [Halocynthiibacter]MCV6825943.1 hypothetical protein [Halocynthiibacter halioticoli]MCW4058944.1 hypothetical protein [Halocynthiibacter sp. SDUM655004]